MAKPPESWTVALPVPVMLAFMPAVVGRLWGLAVGDDGVGISVSWYLMLAVIVASGPITYLLARRRRYRRDAAIGWAFTACAIGFVTCAAGFVVLELYWPNPYWDTD